MSIVNKKQVVRRKRKRRVSYTIAATEKVTHDTWRLLLAGPRLEHQPGQYIVMRRIRAGEKPEPHAFSISSAPRAEHLELTVKEVGDFTATIGTTRPGETVSVDGPFGSFSYNEHDASHLVFIAGGIGITPFLSMLRDLAYRDFDRQVSLIWGNKAERDMAYRSEIETLAEQYPQFKLVHILSEQETWEGEKGYVGAELLQRELDFAPDSQYFICGPAPMIDIVMQLLLDFNIPHERIHTEKFTAK